MSRVIDMSTMFMVAKLFNDDISKWDVSSVTKMDKMFMNAISFKQKLCGAAWVHSKATKDRMFEGSYGLISSTACSASSSQRWLARWEAASTPITTQGDAPAIAKCAKCGTFKKSERVSCCAPGGTWYQKCGVAGSRKFDHSWLEGVEACACKFKVDACACVLLCVDNDSHTLF